VRIPLKKQVEVEKGEKGEKVDGEKEVVINNLLDFF
jgi:hypothetical protein